MSDVPMLRGAMTALITPFKDGQIDEPALRALVDRQIEGHIDGLVPCGTTGESATMSTDERLRVIGIVAQQAAGRVPVIAGTGSNVTESSIAFTQRVSEIPGVSAALVVCPYYNKPTPSMVQRHFESIADEGGLPVVMYNVPGRTVISMTPEVIGNLSHHPNIIGIKEATGDLGFDAEVFELTQGVEGFALLSGDDFTTMPFIASGGHGCISVVSNIDPVSVATMCMLTSQGDLVPARALHLKIQPLARVLFERSNPMPTKALAALLGWCEDEVRAPLYTADAAFVEHLSKVARDYGVLL